MRLSTGQLEERSAEGQLGRRLDRELCALHLRIAATGMQGQSSAREEKELCRLCIHTYPHAAVYSKCCPDERSFARSAGVSDRARNYWVIGRSVRRMAAARLGLLGRFEVRSVRILLQVSVTLTK